MPKHRSSWSTTFCSFQGDLWVNLGTYNQLTITPTYKTHFKPYSLVLETFCVFPIPINYEIFLTQKVWFVFQDLRRWCGIKSGDQQSRTPRVTGLMWQIQGEITFDHFNSISIYACKAVQNQVSHRGVLTSETSNIVHHQMCNVCVIIPRRNKYWPCKIKLI